MEGRSVELFDVVSETAVRILWHDDGREPEVRFLTIGGKSMHVLPAGVVQLAASVLNDPTVLDRVASERV